MDRIGLKSENHLWLDGISDWDTFLKSDKVKGLSAKAKHHFNRKLIEAEKKLLVGDVKYFVDRLPNSEMYRIYDFFWDQCLFIDIETSGYYGDITVIGLYDAENSIFLVKGRNLDKELFEKIISQYKVLISFNGSSFDIPVIERYFGINIEMPHIDLRHVCSRVGLVGGLKSIEIELGIKRPEEVVGADAVMLWQMYGMTGEEKYLEMLIAYNEEDIKNLKPIADRVIPQLWEKVNKL